MENKVKYINRSTYRVKVLKSLKGDVKMPTEIARDCDILPNHISNVLRELRENDIVECINPEVKKGRLYRLSDVGKDVLKEID